MRFGGREFQGFRRNAGGSLEDFRGPGQKGAEYDQTWRGLTRLPVVYTCVTKITGALKRFPRQIVDRQGKPIRVQPMWLEDPNAYMAGGDLISAIAGSLLLDGNAYVFYSKDRRGMVSTVGVANPRVVDQYVEGDRVTWYVNGQMRTTPFLHLRHLTLPGRMKGLARVVPLKTVGDISVESLRYTQVMLMRGMAVQFALKGPAKWVGTRDGRQSIRQMLKDYHSGYRRAFNPLVLLPGMEVEALPSAAVNDSGGFLDLQRATDVQIAASFGVPPESIGLYEPGSSLTYRNEPSRRARFFEEAVAPVAVVIEEALSELVGPGRKFNLDQTDSLYGGPHDRAAYVASIALAEKHTGAPLLSGEEKRKILGLTGPPPPPPERPMATNPPPGSKMAAPEKKEKDDDPGDS